jgi:signal transduction histidine kinase
MLQTLRRPGGLARRLLLLMGVVVAVGALTAWIVARAVGPLVFRSHLTDAESSPGTTFEHAKLAFTSAGTIALAVALALAAITSLAAGLVVARRASASLNALSTAVSRISAGHYTSRVELPGVAAEFDDVAVAFNEMAARLDRHDALQQRLMADVAHELRTPVATIVALLDALEDGVATADDHTFDVLRSQASRLSRLSEDLAAVSRAEGSVSHLHVHEQQPRQILARAAEGIRARCEAANVALVVDTPTQLPIVAVDADRMGQVLGNLLDNALRHTPAGGRIVLSAAVVPEGVEFAVSDTGEGIEPDDLPFVFERFYRVDPARDRAHGGSGIGLSIARALVHAHGGVITASSPGRGQGSRFSVKLPAALRSSRT